MRTLAKEVITNSSVASPEPQNVTIELDSNEPLKRYGYGRQHPNFTISLNDFNLPMNPTNVMRLVFQISTFTVFQLHYQPTDSIPLSWGSLILSTSERFGKTEKAMFQALFYCFENFLRLFVFTT